MAMHGHGFLRFVFTPVGNSGSERIASQDPDI
jgi:hypothetical protein